MIVDISKKIPALELDLAGIILIVLLSIILVILINSRKKIENLDALKQTYFDAEDSLIYLKDESLKYVFINRAFSDFYGKSSEEIIGRDDYAISDKDFADMRREIDFKVIKDLKQVDQIVDWDGRKYRAVKFPVRMLNGNYGVGAYIKDITEEQESRRRTVKMLHRNSILVQVLSKSFPNSQEQLDYVLHQALDMTESKYGYIYIYDEASFTFTLNSWTRGVMDECSIVDPQTKYYLEKTGIWGEVVRQRKPIMVNDFDSPNELKKGYPVGHVQLHKFMSVPIIIDEKIVAVVGLANKPTDYDLDDISEITLLMSGAWHAIVKREAQEQLTHYSFHDSLTGLYNRRFFEEEMRRIDVNRNLPISIISGDVNGLKLMNDIFGHNYGDELLKSISKVFLRICRADDIIARWGGDEFVILLPKTDYESAQKIVSRIKADFSKETIMAIKGSISMGIETKTDMSEDIQMILKKSEEQMYNAKYMDKQEASNNAMRELTLSLHAGNVNEQTHSESVSDLCQRVGNILRLPEDDIWKLKKAGYLHDIGKVASDHDRSDAVKHVTTGYRILNSFDDTRELAEYILAHHEHMDGSGYPRGLKGAEIPFPAKIIAAADHYSRFASTAEGMEFLRKNTNTMFDPLVVKAFEQLS